MLPPPRAAAQWQPPPGLSIMPWTGAPEQLEALEVLRQRMAASPYPDAAGDEATLRWCAAQRREGGCSWRATARGPG